MKGYQQLTQDERKQIAQALTRGEPFKAIGRTLDRHCSTISREVLRNSRAQATGTFQAPFNNCAHRHSCQENSLCTKEDCQRDSCRGCPFCSHLCRRYEREDCPKLNVPPYVCNGCHARFKCTLEKFFYKGREAQKTYEATQKSAKEGICLSPEELERLNGIISPLLLQGQSPHAICTNNKDLIMRDEKTIYKYVKAGLFTAKGLDLPRLVRMRPRRKKRAMKVEAACREGRTYRDFLTYLEQHPDTPVVQMDTVEGKKGDGEKVLLTIHFTEASLMLAFLREANTARSVKEIFDALYQRLGRDLFCRLFSLCLTDNGSEFSNPSALEHAPDGSLRMRLFYCDPRAPYQKGAIENNHGLLRRVIPKGTSLNAYTQKDIDLMMNHINSYARKKLNDRSPYQSFSFFHSIDVLERLGVRLIPTNEITLTPDLLKR